jgi:hypothetical protein
LPPLSPHTHFLSSSPFLVASPHSAPKAHHLSSRSAGRGVLHGAARADMSRQPLPSIFWFWRPSHRPPPCPLQALQAFRPSNDELSHHMSAEKHMTDVRIWPAITLPRTVRPHRRIFCPELQAIPVLAATHTPPGEGIRSHPPDRRARLAEGQPCAPGANCLDPRYSISTLSRLCGACAQPPAAHDACDLPIARRR